jgi:predicted nucleic acid-binding protein
VIHLDTNFIIGAITTPSLVDDRFLPWLAGGEKFAVSAIAWCEFLHGPVTAAQRRDAFEMIEERVIPFGMAEAEIASKLFNKTGRRRGSQPDCFIAATAISSAALLATQNRKDFLPFLPHGLRLA